MQQHSRYQRRKAAASAGDVRLLMERPIWISGHVRMDAPRVDCDVNGNAASSFELPLPLVEPMPL